MNVESGFFSKLSLENTRVISFIKENRTFYKPYVDRRKGILKALESYDETDVFHSTSTAFAFYHISNILKLPQLTTIYPNVSGLKDLMKTFARKQITYFNKEHSVNDKTQIGKLPNNYNTPIQMLGVISSWDHLEDKDLPKKKLFIKLTEKLIKDNFISELKENKGFIGRIGATKVPSPYLTFWVLEAIIAFQKLSADKSINPKSLKSSFDLDELSSIIMNWASDTLSKSISYTYSGLTQSFDAIESSYLILILLSIIDNKEGIKSESTSTNNIKKLISHTLEIIFSKYFNNGCFVKSLPVFSNQANFILSCSTVEPISIMLIKYYEFLTKHSDKLSSIFTWIDDNKYIDSKVSKIDDKEIFLWRTEWEHPSSDPTPFMAFSVFTFLVAYNEFLDYLLSKNASDVLGVTPYSLDNRIISIKYPSDVENIVKTNIVLPIRENKRNIAALSIILFGPPGTSKTTISKKIAQDLKWPLLIINTNSFLKSGIEKIDSEAERIFDLVSHLRNVVVLFDEVEELVLNRDNSSIISDQRSRLLTTSMLPRINDLRRTNRIVFIFATNYIDHMDPAIIRTGRFDCVQCILPPTSEERKFAIKSILEDYEKSGIVIEKTLKSHLQNKEMIKKTERFCYADLDALIKRILVRCKEKSIASEEIKSIIFNEINAGKGTIVSDVQLSQFKINKEKFDKPNYQG